MVNVGPTLEYTDFGGGLNLVDDEIKLPPGQTPRAQNFEIVRATGLQKASGYESLFQEYNTDINITFADNYTNDDFKYSYLAVAYPEIFLADPVNGNLTSITNTLVNTGDPSGAEANGGYFFVDGKNKPRYIVDQTVTTVTWPPVYTNDNNAVGNIDESPYTTSSNPPADDIGIPSIAVFFANRIFLAGDDLNPRRIYASKIGDVTDFSDNDPSQFDIAFFVDIPSSRPITAMKVVSNKFLVVYCDTQIILLSGQNPPGTAYPQPHFSFETLNTDIGCLHKNLVVSKGNNDHYFVGNRGRVYQLSLTESFQDVKPLGLTEKIFPFLAQFDNDTFKRGYLINFQLRGELHFFVPSTNQKRYPDVDLILNYGDRPSEPVWSQNKDIGDNFLLRGGLIDRDNNRMVLVIPRKFLRTNTGTSFDGEPIKFQYQLATLNFGDASSKKEITRIRVYARSSFGANIVIRHLWEDGKSSYKQLSIAADPDSDFGAAQFGIDNFQSGAGLPFQELSYQPLNPIGRLLKMSIENESDDEDFLISSIVFDIKPLGKG
jgi:hypothetical protein